MYSVSTVDHLYSFCFPSVACIDYGEFTLWHLTSRCVKRNSYMNHVLSGIVLKSCSFLRVCIQVMEWKCCQLAFEFVSYLPCCHFLIMSHLILALTSPSWPYPDSWRRFICYVMRSNGKHPVRTCSASAGTVLYALFLSDRGSH